MRKDVEELVSLINRTRSGNLEAYNAVVRRFQDMAVGYAYSILGDFHLAEDAAQEAFVSAYLELSGLRDLAAFPGWFRRIVLGKCGRIARDRKLPTVDLEKVTSVAPQEGSPEALLDARESEDRLLDALQTLPERDRSIITLFYISQFTQKEIAAFLDVPVSTINNRLHLSRKRLHEELVKMTAENLQANRPSRDEAFTASVRQRLQVLESLHRELASELGKVLCETLDQEAEVRITGVEQSTFDRFLASLPSPSLTLHFLMEPSSGRIIFDLSPELALAVEEKLIGTGSSTWKEAEKSMSEEDWRRLKSFGVAIKERLERIWKPIFAVELTDGIWETNFVGLMAHPDFSTLPTAEKLASLHEQPEDLIVRVDMEVRVGELGCRFGLCYPSSTLQTLLPHIE